MVKLKPPLVLGDRVQVDRLFDGRAPDAAGNGLLGRILGDAQEA